MRAVVWKAPYQVIVDEVDDPRIEAQAPVKKYNVYLHDVILSGKAKPSFFVSDRLPLEGAPEAYEKFDKRTDGYRKVLLKPNGRAA